MPSSPDLGIKEIASQQAQPEITHNEALHQLQMLLNGVIDRAVNTPPGSPTEGDAYIVGAAPTGAWAGRANCLAGWFGTAWVFLPGNDDNGTPIAMGSRHEGLTVWVRDEDEVYTWSGSAWVLRPAVMVGDSGAGGVKGLVPAPASGDAAAGRFLSAGGTWSVPAGGGGGGAQVGWVPVQTFNPSGVNEFDISLAGSPPLIAAGTRAIRFRVDQGTTDTDGVDFMMRVGVGGVVDVGGGGNFYYHTYNMVASDAAVNVLNQQNDSEWRLVSFDAGEAIGNASGEGFAGTITLLNFNTATLKAIMQAQFSYWDEGGSIFRSVDNSYGYNAVGAAIDIVRFRLQQGAAAFSAFITLEQWVDP